MHLSGPADELVTMMAEQETAHLEGAKGRIPYHGPPCNPRTLAALTYQQSFCFLSSISLACCINKRLISEELTKAKKVPQASPLKLHCLAPMEKVNFHLVSVKDYLENGETTLYTCPILYPMLHLLYLMTMFFYPGDPVLRPTRPVSVSMFLRIRSAGVEEPLKPTGPMKPTWTTSQLEQT